MKHGAVYVTGTGLNTGKSAVSLGMMQFLTKNMGKIGVFRPIINKPAVGDQDPDINLLLNHFKLDQKYADTYCYTADEAKELMNLGSRSFLIENIIKKFKKVVAAHDFTVCIGTDFPGKDAVYEFELNAELASNLGCPVVLVTNGANEDYSSIVENLRLTMDSLEPYAMDVAATIINRARLGESELNNIRKEFSTGERRALIYAIPENPTLGRANMHDVLKAVDGGVIHGENRMDTLVGDYLVAAMHADNFLTYVEKDQLIITPGDRTDILLAAFSSRLSSTMPDIAGVVLTGGIEPSPVVFKLIEGWSQVPMPIVLTKYHTYNTITNLQKIFSLIEAGDFHKIDIVVDLFARHVDCEEITNRVLESQKEDRITPIMFEFELIERAKSKKQRIVLAEGEDERILRATDILLQREVADIILLGDVDAINTKAKELQLNIGGARLIDPVKAANFDAYAHQYYEFRKAKGITEEKARQVMADATYYATMMVKLDDADGMVSGAVNTTAHTIRPAFEFIKTKPGFSVVSSVFLMCLKDRVLAFGDCAVNPNPTAQQLAEIAVASAHTARVFGIVPRVAMLSYSTGSSGKGADVDVVVEATKIAKEMAPDLALEGPLQYDAAIDPVVARTKLPDSQVAGRATVFIFPDLNTGNNTYKAVQRAAQAIAIGPVLQGLNKPVNDLSRGCLVPDIVNTVAITAVQAASEKK